MDGETPQERAQGPAKVIIDPEHPEAGNGGVVPPMHSRIKPGETLNPGGRPKGASVLSAMLRDLAREPDEDGIGKKAREVAIALIEVSTGRRDPASVDTKAALAILDRTDGPLVKERVITDTTVKRVIVEREEPKRDDAIPS